MNRQATTVAATSLTPQDYASFSTFLQNACGIVLGDNKHYLVTSRLTRLMAELKLESFSELMKHLQSDNKLRIRIMDAMTTNETSWFRDSHPFEALKDKLLPEIAASKPASVRIWSAACSTGQEPYSIAMTISEFGMSRPGLLQTNKIEIVGTDISPSALDQAKRGVYDQAAMARGLPPERRSRYFRQVGGQWVVSDDLRQRVSFRDLNLMQTYALLGKFDVIFCRNVLIYFSAELKKDILGRMAGALKPGGHLILGSSESLSSYSDAFNQVRWRSGVLYQAKPSKSK